MRARIIIRRRRSTPGDMSDYEEELTSKVSNTPRLGQWKKRSNDFDKQADATANKEQKRRKITKRQHLKKAAENEDEDKENALAVCPICRGRYQPKEDKTNLWIGCIVCSTWYHGSCQDLTKTQVTRLNGTDRNGKGKPWPCKSCRESSKQ